MRVTALELFAVPPRWLFLKIETDEGIVGWGEPVVEGRAATVAAAVDELADYLVGKDPFRIEDHWQVLYRGGFYRGGADPHERDRRHRPGAVGHQGQGARRAGRTSCSAARCATASRVYSWIGGDRPSDVARRPSKASRAASPP